MKEEYPEFLEFKKADPKVLGGLLMTAIAMLSTTPKYVGMTFDQVYDEVVNFRKEIIESLEKSEFEEL